MHALDLSFPLTEYRVYPGIPKPLTQPSRLGEDEKEMFQSVASHFELISGLLTIRKCDLDEFEKAMLQGLGRPSQLNLNLRTSRKFDLDEVEKAIIQIVECHFEVIF